MTSKSDENVNGGGSIAHYKYHKVSLDEFLNDVKRIIFRSVNRGDIHAKLQKFKDNGVDLSIPYDEDNAIVIKSKDKNVIKEFGSQKWCIVYSDRYYRDYCDPNNNNEQYIILNFDVDPASDESMFGITIGPNGKPLHGGHQNKANDPVQLDEISRITGVPVEYFNKPKSELGDLENELEPYKNLDSLDNVKEVIEIISKYPNRNNLYIKAIDLLNINLSIEDLLKVDGDLDDNNILFLIIQSYNEHLYDNVNDKILNEYLETVASNPYPKSAILKNTLDKYCMLCFYKYGIDGFIKIYKEKTDDYSKFNRPYDVVKDEFDVDDSYSYEYFLENINPYIGYDITEQIILSYYAIKQIDNQDDIIKFYLKLLEDSVEESDNDYTKYDIIYQVMADNMETLYKLYNLDSDKILNLNVQSPYKETIDDKLLPYIKDKIDFNLPYKELINTEYGKFAYDIYKNILNKDFKDIFLENGGSLSEEDSLKSGKDVIMKYFKNNESKFLENGKLSLKILKKIMEKNSDNDELLSSYNDYFFEDTDRFTDNMSEDEYVEFMEILL